jgi:hypothetical protein
LRRRPPGAGGRPPRTVGSTRSPRLAPRAVRRPCGRTRSSPARRQGRAPSKRVGAGPGSSRRRRSRAGHTPRRRARRGARGATTGSRRSAGRAGSRAERTRRAPSRRGAPPGAGSPAGSPGGPGRRPRACRRRRSPATARRGRACPRSAPSGVGACTPRSWLAPSPVDSRCLPSLVRWLLPIMKTLGPDPPFPRRSLRLGARQSRAGPPGCQGVSRGPGAQHVTARERPQAPGNPFKQAASGLEGGGGGI